MSEFLAVAFGGGRNGAMLLGMYERGIVPDIITFADTGGEKPETYEAVARMSKWAEEHLGQPIVVVRNDGMYTTLENEAWLRKSLPAIVFGFKTCSEKWKIRPQNKHLRSLVEVQEIWKQGRQVTRAVGYDAGETRRAKANTDPKRFINWYPLIEWGWFLEDCVAAYGRHGLPIPQKSACFYCPSSTKKEVLTLAANHSELFQRAVEMERNAAPNLKTVKGLGRHWSWENLVQISNQQMELLLEAPQMACACFDSEED